MRCTSKFEHLAERQLETLDELAELLRAMALHLGLKKMKARLIAPRFHRKELEGVLCPRCQRDTVPPPSVPAEGAAQ